MHTCTNARHLGLALLVSIGVATACSDSSSLPLEPTSPTAIDIGGVRPNKSWSSAGNGQVFIGGVGGTTFTLNAANRAIYASNGVIIELSIEQAASMMNAFGNIVNMDSLYLDIDYAGEPVDPSCGPDVIICEGAQNYAMPFDGSPLQQSTPQSGSPMVLIRPAQPGNAQSQTSLFPGGGEFSMMMSDPSTCHYIAQAMWNAKNNYWYKRSAFIHTLLGILGSAPITWENGAPTIKLPSGHALAVSAEMAAAEKAVSETNMRVLAGMYSIHGCWANDWSDASRGSTPATGSGGGGSAPNIYHIVCEYHGVEISTDGGQTWYTKEVKSCEYQPM